MNAEVGKQEGTNKRTMLKLYKWCDFDEIDYENESTLQLYELQL